MQHTENGIMAQDIPTRNNMYKNKEVPKIKKEKQVAHFSSSFALLALAWENCFSFQMEFCNFNAFATAWLTTDYQLLLSWLIRCQLELPTQTWQRFVPSHGSSIRISNSSHVWHADKVLPAQIRVDYICIQTRSEGVDFNMPKFHPVIVRHRMPKNSLEVFQKQGTCWVFL